MDPCYYPTFEGTFFFVKFLCEFILSYYNNPSFCFWTALLKEFEAKVERPLWGLVRKLRILKVKDVLIFNPPKFHIPSIYQPETLGVIGLGGPKNQKLAVGLKNILIGEFSTSRTHTFSNSASFIQNTRVLEEVIRNESFNSKPKSQLVTNYFFVEFKTQRFDLSLNKVLKETIKVWNPKTQIFENVEMTVVPQKFISRSLKETLDDLPKDFVPYCYYNYLLSGSKFKPVLTNTGVNWLEIDASSSTKTDIQKHFKYLEELRNKTNAEKVAEIIQTLSDKK